VNAARSVAPFFLPLVEEETLPPFPSSSRVTRDQVLLLSFSAFKMYELNTQQCNVFFSTYEVFACNLPLCLPFSGIVERTAPDQPYFGVVGGEICLSIKEDFPRPFFPF